MTLSEDLATSIVEIIRSEQLAMGDALPSSRELAKMFDVTIPTVREALRRLEATSIVEFRHGSGTYVGYGVDRRVLANPHRPDLDRESALELVEARLALEPAIAAAAARARPPAVLPRLERAATAVDPPVGTNRLAVDFHVALAAASGNKLLEESLEALLHLRVEEQLTTRHHYDDRDRDHADHVRIYEAVRDGDAATAERLTRKHLESIQAAIKAAG